MMKRILPVLLAFALGAAPGAGSAATPSLTSVDSFRVGDSGVICTAQRRLADALFTTMFDRAYEIACRDAASPVGKLYALRGPAHHGSGHDDAFSRRVADCGEIKTARIGGGHTVQRSSCLDKSSGLVRVFYRFERGGTIFGAEGLAAYDSALRAGIESLIVDHPVAGDIEVATTGAGDPNALAAIQASQLDPEQARDAGYAHAADGSFAEASEFFESLIARARINEKGANRPAEYLANLALDQSVLGNFAQADELFAQARQAAGKETRPFFMLLRNLEAMHRLNAHDPDGAIAMLDAPLPRSSNGSSVPSERLAEGYIDKPISQRLAVDSYRNARFWGSAAPLTVAERDKLLDAQAVYLRGVALRMKGDRTASRKFLDSALDRFVSVRNGNVRSMAWLPPNIMIQLAELAEADGNTSGAEAYLRRAIEAYASNYPDSASLLGARARLAALQVQHGNVDEGLATYRDLVGRAGSIPGGSEALRGQLPAYFDALVSHGQDAGSAADFFLASQILIRPGVAQTQAVFARELSAGSDEASSLFRQSFSLSRELVSLDTDIARLSSIDQRKADEEAALTAAIARRKQVAVAQTELQARLADFPKYRVTRTMTLSLADLQKQLRGDEAYYKLVLVDEAAYGLMVRAHDARTFRIGATRSELEKLADTVRDSIAVEQNNQLVTFPFDVVAARRLYLDLFGPVAEELRHVHHLIFEPDGPMLKLPANLLVTDQAGVDAYLARQQVDNPDPFDFTGIAWLGRDHVVSTAVSAESFVAVRNIPASAAKRRYLGLGQNTPIAESADAPHSDAGRDPCDWPLATWNKPVSGKELDLAARLLGGTGDEVLTMSRFTDTMLRESSDLADFRIIQFATHGLVTAPKPGCPAQPELVTSFGPRDSDGLLSFKEIFDLHLDADTVILSACDTAGAATADATREAGIATGGNFALDGLVRAFVAAGARTVVASHWPVPDDFEATTRLMTGIYQAGLSESMGEALRQSEVKLMDDPLTSHPYYWAAFAIVGDATKPLTTP